MKTQTRTNLFRGMVLTGCAVMLSMVWLVTSVEAKPEKMIAKASCTEDIVLDKEVQNLDMKLLVHRPYGAPVVILTDI